jgi:hypothetical protein
MHTGLGVDQPNIKIINRVETHVDMGRCKQLYKYDRNWMTTLVEIWVNISWHTHQKNIKTTQKKWLSVYPVFCFHISVSHKMRYTSKWPSNNEGHDNRPVTFFPAFFADKHTYPQSIPILLLSAFAHYCTNFYRMVGLITRNISILHGHDPSKWAFHSLLCLFFRWDQNPWNYNMGVSIKEGSPKMVSWKISL